eukprot:m.225685 g.225685  ORF g.225685 m.225685 type:complete len:308 (+) comp40016_c0_seq48:92-1015(+)
MAVIFILAVSLALLCFYFFYKADRNITMYLWSRKAGYYKDKVVWVTGASSGIGLALAESLSKDGALLILSSRRLDVLESVQMSLANPEKAKILGCDLADPSSLADVAKKAKSLFGRIDVLVNNAGISHRSYVETTHESVVRKVMEVDFFGSVALTKAVLPDMLEKKSGQIVNINSISGVLCMPSLAGYAAAKFAVLGFMGVLRQEVASRNISVVNILPGPVRTDILKNALTADGTPRQKSVERIDKGMTTERCAHLCLIAMENNLKEAWICKQPELAVTYLGKYAPGALDFIFALRTKVRSYYPGLV